MSGFEWAFWILNSVVALYGIYGNSFQIVTRNGTRGIMTPSGWIWIWQGIGAMLVFLLGRSPWHLLWWFPVGYLVSFAVGKALYNAGLIDPFGHGR